jgi:hypothetical protein
LVLLVGIGWYFTGILPINTNEKFVWYISVIYLAGAPFSLQKGGLGPLFDALSPPFEKK